MIFPRPREGNLCAQAFFTFLHLAPIVSVAEGAKTYPFHNIPIETNG